MENEMRNEQKPEVNQTWADNRTNREFRILKIEADKAVVKPDNGGRTTKIRLDRFSDATKKGYSFKAPASER